MDCGAKVDGVAIGMVVGALLEGGGYAEYVCVKAKQVTPCPPALNPYEFAGVIEVAATTWANLIQHAGVVRGDTALIHGGAGGIGSFAIQLLASRGIRTIATVSTEDKAAWCKNLGASQVINYAENGILPEVMRITKNKGVDVILDPHGGSHLSTNIQCLNTGRRLVIIGSQLGALESSRSVSS